MTGAEHYREAERLLAHASDPVRGFQGGANWSASLPLTFAAAQVHATLALAATSDSSVPHPTGYPNGGAA